MGIPGSWRLEGRAVWSDGITTLPGQCLDRELCPSWPHWLQDLADLPGVWEATANAAAAGFSRRVKDMSTQLKDPFEGVFG